MTSSATELVAAVSHAAQLVESDALVVLVDRTDSPAIEALQRMAATGGTRDRIAVIPGPVLLGEQQSLPDPDDRDEAVEMLARAVLEARAEVLVLNEPRPDPSTASCFRTLARMAGYYGARTLVIGPVEAGFAVEAGFDALDVGVSGPALCGIPVATSPDVSPRPAVVTTAWSPRATDIDALRSMARRVHDL
jgi:hypothetical protein